MLKAFLLFFLLPLLHVSRCFCHESVPPSERDSSCPASSRINHDDIGENPNLKKLESVARLIDESQRILVLTGAGTSVAAGIPDFRSPGIGLYDNLAKYKLPYAEAVFDVNYYRENPYPFVALCRDMYLALNKAQPTLTHYFLKALENHNKLLRIYTQNIDGLDVRAGISPRKVIECHGHFRTASCSKCWKAAPIDSVLKAILEDGQVPICEACGNPVKPDITFFGQALPAIFSDNIEPDTDKADLLLVFGTSLNVAPVSLIPSFVDPDIPRVLFNRDPVDMGNAKHQRDFFVEGDCDTNVRTVVELLGW